ncbi:trichohyalin-like [Palaemon carinicauda]|uniref:trichohyalin-like n=1 Tax=Palaemon carinicauda TaxID=392227 RepID=UPI0035B6076A
MPDKGEDPVGAVGFEVAEFLEKFDWEEEIGDLKKVELQEIAQFINISVAPRTKKGTLLVYLVTAIKIWREYTSNVNRAEYISVQDRLELERFQIEKMKLQITTREEERIHEKEMLETKFKQERLRLEREREQEQLRIEREREQEQLSLEWEREQEQLRLEREREQEKHELQVLHLRQVPAESTFNVGNAIKLMPVFKEIEALEFFTVFEKLENRLEWPENMWTTLVQCRLKGKAQKLYAALNEEMSAYYSQVKNFILKAYELVPEAYRQKFRNMQKGWEETFVEFARRKRVAFQEWLKAKDVEDFDALKEEERIHEKEMLEAKFKQERLRLERETEQEQLRIEQEREQEQLRLEWEREQEQLRLEWEREQEQLRLEWEREQETHELQVLHLRQVPAKSKFNIGNAIKVMPVFKETEALEFFTVFEKLANRLEWPENNWTTLVQCRLMGKAQKLYAALNEEMSAYYSQVKNFILKAYELVPEAYHQKFRNMQKGWEETFVEFARRKRVAFQEWLKAKGEEDFDALKELILIEEFKNNISLDLKTHLEDLKLDHLDTLAVAADEFFLSHKGNYRYSDKAKWDTKGIQVEKAQVSNLERGQRNHRLEVRSQVQQRKVEN